MTIGYVSTLVVVYDDELCPFLLTYSCIYWILCLCLFCFSRVQVSYHGDHGDRDLPELRNGSTTSPTSNNVGFQVSLHC